MKSKIPFNSEIIIGITLISFGVFTFAKGTSTYLTKDNYNKLLQEQKENLLNSVSTATNVSSTLGRLREIINQFE